MSDDELLALLHFVLYRFCGYIPDDQMIINAIEDWKRQ